MQEFLLINYEWLRALHIISFVAWMAGMLYLPRLFVYHAGDSVSTEMGETFKLMERRLLRFIMNPAMIASWVFGLSMLYANPSMLEGQGWLHAKLLLVFLLSGLHGYFAGQVKKFARDENTKSTKFFRMINEVPTVIMIMVVILAVVQPF